MSDWHRVFGLNETPPDLAVMMQHLHEEGLPAVPHFRGDDLGWTGGELLLGNETVTIERFLTKADDLRDQLDTWAGWLETRSDQPRSMELMQHVIGAKQLMTLRPTPASNLDQLCDAACRWLARQTDGIYQVDGRGFIAADGTMLLPEDQTPGRS